MYYGSHERINKADWNEFSDQEFINTDHFLAANVYDRHGYDDDISDEVWDNVEKMLYRTNNDTGITEICMIGRYFQYYVIMLAHYVDDDTIEIFHLMPFTHDDIEEFDFRPESWYDFPKSIIKEQNNKDENWWC